MSKPRELLELLLSNPREAGTDGALQARRVLSEHLSQLGFDVEEQPFRFSAASLTAYPLFGAGLGWLMLIQILLLTAPAAPSWAALVTWGVGVVALGVLLAGVSLGWAPLGGQVRDSANLIATRGGIDQVRRWIVAHYDTKAQGISLAGRLVAMMYAAAVVLLITVLAAYGAVRPSLATTPPGCWLPSPWHSMTPTLAPDSCLPVPSSLDSSDPESSPSPTAPGCRGPRSSTSTSWTIGARSESGITPAPVPASPVRWPGGCSTIPCRPEPGGRHCCWRWTACRWPGRVRPP